MMSIIVYLIWEVNSWKEIWAWIGRDKKFSHFSSFSWSKPIFKLQLNNILHLCDVVALTRQTERHINTYESINTVFVACPGVSRSTFSPDGRHPHTHTDKVKSNTSQAVVAGKKMELHWAVDTINTVLALQLCILLEKVQYYVSIN